MRFDTVYFPQLCNCRIWKASLSEIEELFYSTRQRLVGEHSFCSAPLIGVNSFHYTDELSNPVDTPPYWSPLNSTAPNRMKYALAFTEEV